MKHTIHQLLNDPAVKAAIDKCNAPSNWELSNRILYKLCHDYPEHQEPGHIVAKVLIIGRVYAAALERIKMKKRLINDDFYLEAIVPVFKNSQIDQKLKQLHGKTLQDHGIFEETLIFHEYLIKTIGSLEGGDKYLKKRSFASKYLHFHLPELFFIYDSRALESMRQFRIGLSIQTKEAIIKHDLDEEYSKFADQCLQLKSKLQEEGITITNRELDNLLVELANQKLKAKKFAFPLAIDNIASDR
jgi:hypothetical protein